MIAIYRCLYGEDFIQQSIKSISDVCDKILIVWDDKVWGDIDHCIYKGEVVKYPAKFDNILEKIEELKNPKVILHKDHVFSPVGQHKHIIDNILPLYSGPDDLMIIEVDMVFRQDQLKKALHDFHQVKSRNICTSQVEVWKMKYRIPYRDRPGVQFVHAKPASANMLSDAFNHNFGFSFSDQTMYWKHMTAIGFSPVIKDSLPNEKWFEDKWLKWDINTNNSDLEISQGAEKNISHAYEYPASELPEVMGVK